MKTEKFEVLVVSLFYLLSRFQHGQSTVKAEHINVASSLFEKEKWVEGIERFSVLVVASKKGGLARKPSQGCELFSILQIGRL